MVKYALAIPVLNGGNVWKEAAQEIFEQIDGPEKVLVIDSGSSDGSDIVAENYGFEVKRINKKNFDHGGTRQLAVSMLPGYDFIVFMTQDAILNSKNALSTLVSSFEDENVAVTYGRQMPHLGATFVEAHARLFNYPAQSMLKNQGSIEKYGIKTAFCSNSFAAYRVSSLQEVGGFPERSIFAEDMYVAAKLILNNKVVSYKAEATCRHSHNYTLLEEFRRSFDIGVFHSHNPWLLEKFGSAEGEGKKFVISEMIFLMKRNLFLIPFAFLRVLIKFIGYKFGKNEAVFSEKAKSFFSFNRYYWER